MVCTKDCTFLPLMKISDSLVRDRIEQDRTGLDGKGNYKCSVEWDAIGQEIM